MEGNLGRGVMKVSAVALENQIVEAPAMVFQDQQDLADAFKAGLLEKDFVAVMRFQGPRSNGMPELHKMTPFLGVLQDRGFKVALVTDGRMSGASGKSRRRFTSAPKRMSAALWRGCKRRYHRVDGVKGTWSSRWTPKNLQRANPPKACWATTSAPVANCLASCVWPSARRSRAPAPSLLPWRRLIETGFGR
jgi:phosphogluconate dehydratase